MSNRVSGFLLAIQAVGAVFFTVFLAAYVFGLQATSPNIVLHSDPVFRLVLSVFGGLLLVMIAVAVVLSYVSKVQVNAAS
ncbi:MAG: TMEM199/VMA12 family vacuolar ATPase assembly factor [Candidatus Bathyarchaeota archaeon]|nr:TMEM199/VMA12 family vacuolar ATPase assembly factor [Candidatus Bathyarchaeota archaeon]